MTTETAASDSYTRVDLRSLDDAAAAQAPGAGMEARFARTALECAQTGVSLQKLAPGTKQPFSHKHAEDEEIYVVIAGSGHAVVDGDSVELATLNALRVAPTAVRTFEAGDEGMEYLAFGSHTENDGEIIPPS
jgi:uncharacterized cupin superfamily protein